MLPFKTVQAQHLYPRVLPMLSELKQGRVRRTPASPVAVHDPHGKRPHRLLVSLFSLTYSLVDNWLSRVRWAWPKLARNGLFVHDRHMIELNIDARRFRFSGPAWLARLMTRLMPQPDLLLLLDAPADVLQSRKQEVPFEETVRQRNAYRQLVEAMPTGCIIDASQPAEQVVGDVREAIWRFLERRTARRFLRGRRK